MTNTFVIRPDRLLPSEFSILDVRAAAEALIGFERAMGTTVTWAGAEYPCISGADSSGRRIEAGGFARWAEAGIIVRPAVFPEGVPKVGQTLLYKRSPNSTPKQLRIHDIVSIYNYWLVLNCKDPADFQWEKK